MWLSSAFAALVSLCQEEKQLLSECTTAQSKVMPLLYKLPYCEYRGGRVEECGHIFTLIIHVLSYGVICIVKDMSRSNPRREAGGCNVHDVSPLAVTAELSAGYTVLFAVFSFLPFLFFLSPHISLSSNPVS